tara:strand:- start:1736 stop:1963 length:228 start_codon:yes stop_codon:yes gene_type:complete
MTTTQKIKVTFRIEESNCTTNKWLLICNETGSCVELPTKKMCNHLIKNWWEWEFCSDETENTLFFDDKGNEIKID